MKIDISKDITLTSSKAGPEYLDLNITLEDGKRLKITALVGTMAGIGLVLTRVTTHLIAKKIGATVEWETKPENLN